MEVKPRDSTRYATVLRHTQSIAEAATGGGRLRDVDGDGVFEYEEIGACGAGPNCEGWIFKIQEDRRRMHLLFHEGYADFRRVSNYYVASGRANCCSWEHHLYEVPSDGHAIEGREPLYRITVGSVDGNDTDSTPCVVSTRVRGKWVLSAIPDNRLSQLCEVYGPDYIINPPRAMEGQ